MIDDGAPRMTLCAECERETLPRMLRNPFIADAPTKLRIVVEPASGCPYCRGWVNDPEWRMWAGWGQ